MGVDFCKTTLKTLCVRDKLRHSLGGGACTAAVFVRMKVFLSLSAAVFVLTINVHIYIYIYIHIYIHKYINKNLFRTGGAGDSEGSHGVRGAPPREAARSSPESLMTRHSIKKNLAM